MDVLGTVILIVESGAAEVIVEEVVAEQVDGFGEGIDRRVSDTNLSQNFTPMLQ